MDVLALIKTVALIGLGGYLSWLIWNGLSTGSVWVRGVRDMRSANIRDWATPISRDENPAGFWLAIGFYSFGIAFVAWALALF
ncbi:MAG: hypothetical protein AAF270_03000 [Pseudomonadota bacterium]